MEAAPIAPSYPSLTLVAEDVPDISQLRRIASMLLVGRATRPPTEDEAAVANFLNLLADTLPQPRPRWEDDVPICDTSCPYICEGDWEDQVCQLSKAVEPHRDLCIPTIQSIARRVKGLEK